MWLIAMKLELNHFHFGLPVCLLLCLALQTGLGIQSAVEEKQHENKLTILI